MKYGGYMWQWKCDMIHLETHLFRQTFFMQVFRQNTTSLPTSLTKGEFQGKISFDELLVVFSYLPHRFDMIEVGRKSFFITCFRLPKSQVGKEAAEELVGSFGACFMTIQNLRLSSQRCMPCNTYEMLSFHG